jgi:replicative DNA helicase
MSNLYDARMERVVLGCLVMDGLTAAESCTRLTVEMFALDSHQRIYHALLDIFEAGATCDQVVLCARLREKGEIEMIGGEAYIFALTEGLPRRLDPASHVATIIELWKKREGVRMCLTAQNELNEMADSGEVLSGLQQGIFDVMQEQSQDENPAVGVQSGPALERYFATTNEAGLTYGLEALDKKTGGAQRGEVTVVGARNGVGKSTAMIQMVHANASRGIPVEVFSLEMKRDTVLRNLWCIESGVEARKLRRPILANYFDREQVKKAAERVAKWPLRIHDKAGMDVRQIAAHSRMSARKYGTQLVCVDYAQIVGSDGRDERSRVSHVSRTLTSLAKTENLHCMILSQVRKVPPEQYKHPPSLGDLRDSSALGDDAHVVVMIHRAYEENSLSLSLEGEFIIPKQREGSTGAFPVTFNPDSKTFS